ncbi:MAG: hypothetical protein JRN20_15485 [Nitrososphaerota archaeon]|nr:hypothetical protein [Nitrososphaerota archaeon]
MQDKLNIPEGRTLYTHCTNCDYESRGDFQACPRCKIKGSAVLVLKSS